MSTRWIDFKALKAQVPIAEVLRRYGYLDELTKTKRGELVGPCPIHGGTNGTSFNVDTGKNVFHCFSQCGGGNVLDLVMRIEGIEIREAGEKLCDWFDLQFDRQERTAHQREGPTSDAGSASTASIGSRNDSDERNSPLDETLVAKIHKNMKVDHPYLFERGLTVPTIERFGVGYCTRGMMQGRIAIPIHNDAGDVVAFVGRAVAEKLAEEKGKYKLPPGFKKSAVLYNLHRAVQSRSGTLIVVEGFFGAMHVHQAGFENVVALMGSTLSDQQEQLLLEHTDRLVLLFDGDDAGRECERECYRRLRTRIFLRSVHLSDGEQPDTLTVQRILELLAN